MDGIGELYGLWCEQGGACCCCSGPTFVPDREAKDSARRRQCNESGVAGSGKHLNQHVATIDSATKAMACKFCNSSRGGRAAAVHRKVIQRLLRSPSGKSTGRELFRWTAIMDTDPRCGSKFARFEKVKFFIVKNSHIKFRKRFRTTCRMSQTLCWRRLDSVRSSA